MPRKRPSGSDDEEEEDDDPVVFEYPIVIAEDSPEMARYLLQYTDRSTSRPYNSQTQLTPSEVRVKPNTGIFQVDVPLPLGFGRYDEEKARLYGKALKESKLLKSGGSFGLAGGFATDVPPDASSKAQGVTENRVKVTEDGDGDCTLTSQTMSGKTVAKKTTDPIDMIGVFKDGALHISKLDGYAHLRPDLHHLDALDEIKRRAKSRPTNEESPARAETSRAVEMRVKSADGEEMNMKKNVDLLQKIQLEKFNKYGYHDEHNTAANAAATETITHNDHPFSGELDSMLTGHEFADACSAPRIDPADPNKKTKMMNAWYMVESESEAGETTATEDDDADIIELVEEEPDVKGKGKEPPKAKGRAKKNAKVKNEAGSASGGAKDATEAMQVD